MQKRIVFVLEKPGTLQFVWLDYFEYPGRFYNTLPKVINLLPINKQEAV